MPEFRFEDWELKDRDAKIKAFVDSGIPQDQAEVMVDAALNAAGAMSDADAHRPDAQGRRQTVTRVQAPLTDPNDPNSDPSPDPDQFRKTGPG